MHTTELKCKSYLIIDPLSDNRKELDAETIIKVKKQIMYAAG